MEEEGRSIQVKKNKICVVSENKKKKLKIGQVFYSKITFQLKYWFSCSRLMKFFTSAILMLQ